MLELRYVGRGPIPHARATDGLALPRWSVVPVAFLPFESKKGYLIMCSFIRKANDGGVLCSPGNAAAILAASAVTQGWSYAAAQCPPW